MLAEIFGVDGLIVVIVLVVVLFGGAAIPKLARNLGSAKNEFEKGLEESPEHKIGGDGSVLVPDVPVETPVREPEGASPRNEAQR
jgi:TatA/E family protein of Tat protein translocase